VGATTGARKEALGVAPVRVRERTERERVGLVGGKTEERGTTGSQRKRTVAWGFLQGVQGSGGALGFAPVGWLGRERVAGGLLLAWEKGRRLGLLAWPVGKLFLPLFFI
jgi:hypothetical protein